MFPSAVTKPGADGKPTTAIEPVKEGSDIQSTFFDMWRQEHADAPLEDVPGDMVTASASGLDPDISLANACYQLDRVAGKWAQDLHREDRPREFCKAQAEFALALPECTGACQALAREELRVNSAVK